jgi:hypothetical protein
LRAIFRIVQLQLSVKFLQSQKSNWNFVPRSLRLVLVCRAIV